MTSPRGHIIVHRPAETFRRARFSSSAQDIARAGLRLTCEGLHSMSKSLRRCIVVPALLLSFVGGAGGLTFDKLKEHGFT